MREVYEKGLSKEHLARLPELQGLSRLDQWLSLTDPVQEILLGTGYFKNTSGKRLRQVAAYYSVLREVLETDNTQTVLQFCAFVEVVNTDGLEVATKMWET